MVAISRESGHLPSDVKVRRLASQGESGIQQERPLMLLDEALARPCADVHIAQARLCICERRSGDDENVAGCAHRYPQILSKFSGAVVRSVKDTLVLRHGMIECLQVMSFRCFIRRKPIFLVAVV